MNRSQAQPNNFEQFIKILFENLQNITEDQPVEKIIQLREAVNYPAQSSIQQFATMKQYTYLYNKIMDNLAQYYDKKQGSKIKIYESRLQKNISVAPRAPIRIEQMDEDRQQIKSLEQQIQRKDGQLRNLKIKIKELQTSLQKMKQLNNKQLQEKKLAKAYQNNLSLQKLLQNIINLKKELETGQHVLQKHVNEANRMYSQQITILKDQVARNEIEREVTKTQSEKAEARMMKLQVQLKEKINNQCKLQKIQKDLNNEIKSLRQKIDLQARKLKTKDKQIWQLRKILAEKNQWYQKQILKKNKKTQQLSKQLQFYQKQILKKNIQTQKLSQQLYSLKELIKVKEQQVLIYKGQAEKQQKQLLEERQTVQKQQKKIRDIQKKVKAIFQENDKEKDDPF